jgi:hypothetical protein
LTSQLVQPASAGNVYHVENGRLLENDKSLDSLLFPVKEAEYMPHHLKKPKRKKQEGFTMGSYHFEHLRLHHSATKGTKQKVTTASP